MKIVLLVCLIITAVAAANGASSDIGAPLLMIDTVVFILCLVRKKPKKETPEKQARREQREARAQAQMEQWKEDNTIVSTAIVNSTTIGKQKASVTSSVVRGAVGGAVFGPVGLIAGAVTPKKTITTKTKDVTFSIRYASGRCTTEKVKFGSLRYKELIKYIA